MFESSRNLCSAVVSISMTADLLPCFQGSCSLSVEGNAHHLSRAERGRLQPMVGQQVI